MKMEFDGIPLAFRARKNSASTNRGIILKKKESCVPSARLEPRRSPCLVN
jgi:hypothetical protein